MITLDGTRIISLSPQTAATILDCLATSGPWNKVNPAIQELLKQLEDKPVEQPIADPVPADPV